MDSPPDWDLLALVRSCSSTTTTTSTTAATTTTTTTKTVLPSHDLVFPQPTPPPLQQLPPILPQQEQLCFSPTPSTPCSTSSVLFGFSTPSTTTSFLSQGHQELNDVYRNNMNSVHSFQSLSSSSLTSPICMVSQQQQQQHQQLRHVVKPSHVIFGASSPTLTTTRGGGASQSQRTRKRKNLMKKVCHVPAEGLSSDMWAWRKYGQKPIKGSPHPRGYYRCSSSKGCLARKQVERNRSDPKMFIVTYTSEHNHPMPTHRNSLAGSTRQKPLTPTGTPEQPTCSSPSPSATSLSPLAGKLESKNKGENLIKDEEDNDMEGLSEFMLNDDFYVGFEQIDGGSDDSDCFSEHFSPSSEFSWLVNGGTTAATANGG